MSKDSHPFLREYRDWYTTFMEQKVLLSPPDEERFPGGKTITVCDGTKHRTLVTGSYDVLASISPCDQSCSQWQEKTGRDVREIVPNLSEEWFTSGEDTDQSERLRRIGF